MENTLFVLKVGGQVLEQPEITQSVVQKFAAWPGPKILVHGGGRKASRIAQALGIPPKMHEGRRITDKETLEVVTMVYAGLYNKTLVASLQAAGCNAIGLSGADGNSILAHKRRGTIIDYGFAGDIDSVDTQGISSLLVAGFTPVFCAITHDKQGQLLNTNADTIAATIAASFAPIKAVSLQFCFEKPGVLSDPEQDDSVIPVLSYGQYQNLKAAGNIHSGMIPKLDNAYRALRSGIKQIMISDQHAIGIQAGTLLTL